MTRRGCVVVVYIYAACWLLVCRLPGTCWLPAGWYFFCFCRTLLCASFMCAFHVIENPQNHLLSAFVLYMRKYRGGIKRLLRVKRDSRCSNN
jgi:hypothetical protein